MKYEVIQHPHLPTGKVCHIACGRIPNEIQSALLQYADEIITLASSSAIESALQNHADLSICPLPGNKIFLSDSQLSLKEKLISLGFCVIMQKNIQSPYPYDCALNFVNTGYYTIYNSSVHDYCFLNDSRQMAINVKQGYVKCSVVPVAKNAIITDDPAIAKQCEYNGMEVCFIRKGDIHLDGYPYGFIGGCCGKLSEHILAFCGNIESHRDCNKMLAFLSRHAITAVSLSNAQLMDIGSLIPLTQEKG